LLTARDEPSPVCAVGQVGTCSSRSEELSGVTAISAGVYTGLALLSNGEVAAWGENYYGELGNGSASGPEVCDTHPCSTDPVHVEHITEATAVSAGWYQSMALLKGGSVETWGTDTEANLGDGTMKAGFSDIYSDVPVFVCAVAHAGTCPNVGEQLTGVTSVAAGGQKGLVRLGSGHAADWGSNEGGGLGLGTMSGPETCEGGPCSEDPMEVHNLSEVIGISSDTSGLEGSSLALLKDGNVTSWGGSNLGDGVSGARDEPVGVCAVEHVGTCPNPGEYLTGATAVSTDGFTDSMAIAPVSECLPTTAQWYSDGHLICERTEVSTKGKLTLEIDGSEASVTCKVSDLEVLENPGTDGPGRGTITEFVLSHCKAKGTTVCPRGEILEVLANAPWSTELSTESPIRDEVSGVELQVVCRSGAAEAEYDRLTGTLEPEVKNSALVFAAGSGELAETRSAAKATISGSDKMKGPKKDTKITAETP
jgi:Regulator of chromosome condensation (RCC1) repeat